MRTISQRSLVVAAFAAVVMVNSCGGKGLGGMGPDLPKDPRSCELGTTDVGRKLNAFLDATSQLDKKVKETVEVVKTSCVMMGEQLGMPAGDLQGETKDICARVTTAIKDGLKVAFKPKFKLNVQAKPAVCTVDVQATAKAAAECEGKAEADVGVKCEGSCTGTCNGTCNGKCAGAAGTGGSGGQCNGQCDGTCEGSCSGGCDGHADVNASAQCKASAEVKASVDVQCTPPEVKIEVDAKFIVDKTKAEATLNALRKGLPEILSIRARIKPLQGAVKTWLATIGELKGSVDDIASSFKDQALCVTNKIRGAIDMATNIQVNFEVSVEVSAEVSGSAGVN